MKRNDLVELLAQRIAQISLPHPLRVAIDGIDASGKTCLAAELETRLSLMGRTVIRASIDSFHQPREIRYSLGEMSPEGYFLYSFDQKTLINYLLKPLGPSGSRWYATAIFEYRDEKELKQEKRQAAEQDILLFDGIFLQKEELKPYWDLIIFVDIRFDTGLKRALKRDLNLFGNEKVIRDRYLKRYYPGQELYFRFCSPKSSADIVVDNNDPDNPGIVIK